MLVLAVAHLVPCEAAAAEEGGEDGDNSIIVRGQALRPDLLADILPEDELSEADIAAYGANTVGDLLQILGEELGSDGEEPVVLINGRQASGLKEAVDLPTEALENVRLLPREAAARLGQSSTRRVISIQLKPFHRQATLLGEAGAATAGGGRVSAGEVNLLSTRSGNRDSLALRFRDTAPLFESERQLRPDVLAQPYDIAGNLLSAPVTGLAIDPALSAAFGAPVTIVALDGLAGTPSRARLLAGANRTNVTDAAPARTLRPGIETFSVNGTVTRKIGQADLSLNGRAEWIDTEGLGGLVPILVPVSGTSPFAPVASNTAIARFVARPLEQAARSFNLDTGANLAVPLGRWQLTALLDLDHRTNRAVNDTGYDLSSYFTGVAAGTADPFAPIGVTAAMVQSSRTSFNGDRVQIQAIAAGPLFRLPAGSVLSTFKGAVGHDRASSTSLFGAVLRERRQGRTEGTAQANLQLPLAAGRERVGALGLDLAGAVRQATAVGTLLDYGAVLRWLAAPGINLQSAASFEEIAPAIEVLTDPVLTTRNYRVFDFATNQTVLASYLSGGNPDLPVGSRRTLSASGTFDLSRALKLNAEISRRTTRDFRAMLPPNSASVQAAFPDRYLRDASGRLVQVDGRPVSFARETVDQVRWGLDLRTVIGRDRAAAARSGGERGPRGFTGGRATRLQVSLDHYWVLRNERQARDGLPVIDMLEGGAAGYGAGISRHSLRLNASAATAGVGVQLAGVWRSSSSIRLADVPSAGDLSFSAYGTLSLRSHADLGTLWTHAPVLKGTRLAIEVDNLFNQFQRVSDASGLVPIRYQPAFLDPLGRTVQVSVRKVF